MDKLMERELHVWMGNQNVREDGTKWAEGRKSKR